MTKIYFKYVSILISLIIWIGFIGPFCISGATELVIGYLVLSIVSVPFVYKIIKPKSKKESIND
jgi:hypothetical protein